jgi:CRP-like cAMP-binding protein
MVVGVAEAPKPLQNQLLAAMPMAERKRLFPHLEPVTLTLGQVLYESGERLDHVYFPVTAVVSLLYDVMGRAPAEISVVGCEGLIGLALMIGGESTLNRAIVQSPGHAYRVPGQQLHMEFSNDEQLQRLLLRYSRALLIQMTQTAECNWHHPLHQRVARWLLLSLDRMPSNQVPVTQGMAATIMGVAREEVSGACARLQRLGAIGYTEDRITILNRPQLERLSCECYAVVRGEADRLMPVSQHKLRPVI